MAKSGWTPDLLKIHFDAINEERRRTVVVASLGMIAVAVVAFLGSEKATAVAFTAATEKGLAHNGLIDRMREMARQYVTWPVVILLLSLAVSVGNQLWGR